jgi:hypothetical protein
VHAWVGQQRAHQREQAREHRQAGHVRPHAVCNERAEVGRERVQARVHRQAGKRGTQQRRLPRVRLRSGSAARGRAVRWRRQDKVHNLVKVDLQLTAQRVPQRHLQLHRSQRRAARVHAHRPTLPCCHRGRRCCRRVCLQLLAARRARARACPCTCCCRCCGALGCSNVGGTGCAQACCSRILQCGAGAVRRAPSWQVAALGGRRLRGHVLRHVWLRAVDAQPVHGDAGVARQLWQRLLDEL